MCAQLCLGGGGIVGSTAKNTTTCARDPKTGKPLTQFPEPRNLTAPYGSGYYLWHLYVRGSPCGAPCDAPGGEVWGADFSLVDRVMVPTDIAPGEYSVGWRWDAEGTHQVWQNCADVSIKSDDDLAAVPSTAAPADCEFVVVGAGGCHPDNRLGYELYVQQLLAAHSSELH